MLSGLHMPGDSQEPCTCPQGPWFPSATCRRHRGGNHGRPRGAELVAERERRAREEREAARDARACARADALEAWQERQRAAGAWVSCEAWVDAGREVPVRGFTLTLEEWRERFGA